MWPCIVTNSFAIKPTRCTNFTNLFWHETLHVSDSSSVHHQEFIDILIYLLTAIGLSPGGFSTVHIYTQTVHRTTQNKQYIQHNNLGECGPCPVLVSYTLAFALQLNKKHGKASVRVKNLSQGKTPQSGYTQQRYMSYRFEDSFRAGAYAPARQLSANLYDIYNCWV